MALLIKAAKVSVQYSDSGHLREASVKRKRDGWQMRGGTVQILDGSVWRNVPKFAIPVALTGILGQLFNAADIAIVGRFTGSEGTVNMAAVGANSPVVGLILNIFIGISLGANVVIANAVGRKDSSAVKKAVHSSILFSLLAGAAVTIIGELSASLFLLQCKHHPMCFRRPCCIYGSI